MDVEPVEGCLNCSQHSWYCSRVLFTDPAGSRITSWTSLSPRPEMLITSVWARRAVIPCRQQRRRRHGGARFQRGMMPLGSARAARKLPARQYHRPRCIQPVRCPSRRNARARLRDNPARQSRNGRSRFARTRPAAHNSTNHAARPARRTPAGRRARPRRSSGRPPPPRRDSGQTIFDQRMEDPSGVRSAAHARDHSIRKPSRQRQAFGANSRPITLWKSRTIVGNGCGPTTLPRM